MTPTFKRADPAGRAFRRPPYPTESGSPLCPLASRRAPHRAIVRIYLDGNETPVVAGLFQDIFNGTGLFPPPFAHKSLSSAVSYFPLPFAEGLKISLDEEPFFYNISARLYEPGTKVVSFSPELMASLSREITEAGDRLTGTVPNMSDTIGGDLQLSPGCQETIPLPDGPQAITSLRVTMDSMEPAALRGSVLRIIFDDEETVFCPFRRVFRFGTGPTSFRNPDAQYGPGRKHALFMGHAVSKARNRRNLES